MSRRILHIDMDAFFASVETALNPVLRGKPIIVGGNADDARSVVSSASYEARRYGVRSAMPIAQARRLCPEGIFIPCSHGIYGEVSRRIEAILETVTPFIQMASIDEANLDITGSIHLFKNEGALAVHVKKSIEEQEHITATVGIASNKMVAKIAANTCKPDGYLSIDTGRERAFLAPLSVEVLPGVGPNTRESLESRGIMTVRQVLETPEPLLAGLMGSHGARCLLDAAMGMGSDTIETRQMPKSISRETTFSKDEMDWAKFEPVLFRLAEQCAYALRSEGLETSRVTLKVRYSDFQTKTFATSLPEPTALDSTLLRALRELISKGRGRRARVRLIGVNLSVLSYNQHQMELFNREREEKWERTMRSVDAVRDKLGFGSVGLGSALGKNTKDNRSSRQKKNRDSSK